MTDASPPPRSTSQTASGKLRSRILLAVLAVLLVALGFDYLVARPRVSAAYDAIAERHMEVNANANEILTNQDIHELLGKEPARTFPDGSTKVEVFSWASGVPFRTHDLFVVYQKSGDRQMFRRHSKFAYERESDVSPVNQVVEADGEMPAEEPAAPGAGGGAETPAGDAANGESPEPAPGASATPAESPSETPNAQSGAEGDRS